ncbi:hypothetical protein [Micromonospora sp. NBRC 101691]|nr:hypothetical protein [Micromonospora sp. NBRC 101691]
MGAEFVEFLGWQVVPVTANGGQQSRREVVLDVPVVDGAGQTP